MNYLQPGDDYNRFVTESYTTDFSKRTGKPKISKCKEWCILFKRNGWVSFKSPIGTIALLMMAFFNSFILSTVFGGVGSAEIMIPSP